MNINRRRFLRQIREAAAIASITALARCSNGAPANTEAGENKNILLSDCRYPIPTVYSPSSEQYNSIFYVQVNRKKCRQCGTCASICPTGIIRLSGGGKAKIADPRGCMNCGQCLINCPSNAIYENVTFVSAVKAALADPDTIVVAMTAPAVRYALGESFGLPAGTYTEGKMVSALRTLGFDVVWDVQSAADLTIFEEAHELIKRIADEKSAPLPQFTSCCPGWIKYAESFFPDLLPNLSSCKSPVAMLGCLAKTYGADKRDLNKQKIFTVSFMPCIAKKYEGLRPEMNSSTLRDIDATITTRELAEMIQNADIPYSNLGDSYYDSLMGASTGAATIFGASGGVTEAALRFAYEAISGDTLVDLDFEEVRGTGGVREATVTVPGSAPLKVCVVTGLSNVETICNEVRQGSSPYHLIEVMACPGGCVNGGGQPKQAA